MVKAIGFCLIILLLSISNLPLQGTAIVLLILLSPATKWMGNIGLTSVRASVRPSVRYTRVEFLRNGPNGVCFSTKYQSLPTLGSWWQSASSTYGQTNDRTERQTIGQTLIFSSIMWHTDGRFDGRTDGRIFSVADYSILFSFLGDVFSLNSVINETNRFNFNGHACWKQLVTSFRYIKEQSHKRINSSLFACLDLKRVRLW